MKDEDFTMLITAAVWIIFSLAVVGIIHIRTLVSYLLQNVSIFFCFTKRVVKQLLKTYGKHYVITVILLVITYVWLQLRFWRYRLQIDRVAFRFLMSVGIVERLS